MVVKEVTVVNQVQRQGAIENVSISVNLRQGKLAVVESCLDRVLALWLLFPGVVG